MILFIRSKKNRTIVDIEFYKKSEDGSEYLELHSSIDIKEYSNFLLDNLDKKNKIISTFNELSELRGWLWENYFMGRQNVVTEYSNVLKILREMLHKIADDFDLNYVED